MLLHNDYLATTGFCENNYLTFNMLRSPTVETPELLKGTRWLFTSHEMINFLDGREVTETALEAGTNTIAITGGVLNWITLLNQAEVSSKADYIETVNSVAKTYTTLTTTEGFQSEITANTTAITGIQNELIILGIASVVNGLFTFPSENIIHLHLLLE